MCLTTHPLRTIQQQIFGTANGFTGVCVYGDLAPSMSPVPTIFWSRYVDIFWAVPADWINEILAHINSINSEREGKTCYSGFHLIGLWLIGLSGNGLAEKP